MTFELQPEVEAMIRTDVQRGCYESVEQYVAEAVRLLHEQETWFSRDREQIEAMVEAGWQSAERGELLNEDQLRDRMTKFKERWAGRRGR